VTAEAITTGPGVGLQYRWPAALVLLALAWLLTLWLLWPSVVSISHVWLNSETYAHGIIILPLALFLAWTRRKELTQVAPRPWAWGLLWIAAAGLAWLLARSVDVKTVQHFALVAMLPGLVLTLLGPRVAWVLVFPLAYIFFAVPFGDFIVPILMDYTAWFTVLMLRISGLAVYSDGYYISIPAGNFVVVEACSGVRYLIASVALGLMYAYLSYRSIWRRLALVALAIALPILANGLRAYGIVMVAHWTDMKHAVGVDHLIYGWVFFGFVMVLLFWIGSLWWEKDGEGGPVAPQSQAVAGVVSMPFLALLLVGLVLVLAAPRGIEQWVENRALEIAATTPAALPGNMRAWSGPEEVPEGWRPLYHDAHTELAGLYRADGAALELHLFQYLNHGRGSEIVSWRNQINDGRIWRRSSERSLRLVNAEAGPGRVHETVLRGNGDQRRLVWHWYQVGDHATISGVEVKLREAAAVFQGDGRGAFLVAVSAEGDLISLDDMRERLARFVQVLPLPLGYGDE
jgi:exosortase A